MAASVAPALTASVSAQAQADFYAKLARLEQDVLAGTHPRLRLDSPKLAHALAPPVARLPGLTTLPNGTAAQHAPSPATLDKASTSRLQLVVPKKPDELIRAELHLKRIRIEKALKETAALRKTRSGERDVTPLNGALVYDVADILSKAQTFVKPVSVLNVDVDPQPQHSPNPDSYYSSKANSQSDARENEHADTSETAAGSSVGLVLQRPIMTGLGPQQPLDISRAPTAYVVAANTGVGDVREDSYSPAPAAPVAPAVPVVSAVAVPSTTSTAPGAFQSLPGLTTISQTSSNYGLPLLPAPLVTPPATAHQPFSGHQLDLSATAHFQTSLPHPFEPASAPLAVTNGKTPPLYAPAPTRTIPVPPVGRQRESESYSPPPAAEAPSSSNNGQGPPGRSARAKARAARNEAANKRKARAARDPAPAPRPDPRNPRKRRRETFEEVQIVPDHGPPSPLPYIKPEPISPRPLPANLAEPPRRLVINDDGSAHLQVEPPRVVQPAPQRLRAASQDFRYVRRDSLALDEADYARQQPLEHDLRRATSMQYARFAATPVQQPRFAELAPTYRYAETPVRQHASPFVTPHQRPAQPRMPPTKRRVVVDQYGNEYVAMPAAPEVRYLREAPAEPHYYMPPAETRRKVREVIEIDDDDDVQLMPPPSLLPRRRLQMPLQMSTPVPMQMQMAPMPLAMPAPPERAPSAFYEPQYARAASMQPLMHHATPQPMYYGEPEMRPMSTRPVLPAPPYPYDPYGYSRM